MIFSLPGVLSQLLSEQKGGPVTFTPHMVTAYLAPLLLVYSSSIQTIKWRRAGLLFCIYLTAYAFS